MELNLFHKKTIGEVKRQFARNFPYLKLEFLVRPNGNGNGLPAQQRLNDHVSLAEIKTVRLEGALSFSPSITIAAFEDLLQKEFGLLVQVYSKSGDSWLETSNTGNLSLLKQNSMGEAASRPVRANMATLFL